MEAIYTYNEQYKFYKITCLEGWLTLFKDGEDIKEYYATKEMYAPTKIAVRCISDKENEEYLKQKENDKL